MVIKQLNAGQPVFSTLAHTLRLLSRQLFSLKWTGVFYHVESKPVYYLMRIWRWHRMVKSGGHDLPPLILLIFVILSNMKLMSQHKEALPITNSNVWIGQLLPPHAQNHRSLSRCKDYKCCLYHLMIMLLTSLRGTLNATNLGISGDDGFITSPILEYISHL